VSGRKLSALSHQLSATGFAVEESFAFFYPPNDWCFPEFMSQREFGIDLAGVVKF
jgi:hypothetical protein